MTSTPEAAAAALLREAAAAHAEYESSVLGGVRDEDWANWYAVYLLDRGLGDLLPAARDIETSGLAALLGRYDAEFRREQPAWPWPDVYARQLVAAFGSSA